MKSRINKNKKQIEVLIVGYNGANNTGAEALLQADIEDVRAVLGTEARITIPTLCEANLRRYLSESPTLRIVPMPTLFFGAIRSLVKKSDLVLLAEGSTYMDTWGSPLLWLFLWATHCAAKMNKPSLAYAVDAGSLSPANRQRVKNIASRTGLIVTRTKAAANRLRAIGVTAPLACTADNAFTFKHRESDSGWLAQKWRQASNGVVGFAMMDFSLFPVVMRPWGPRQRCYKWPYYFPSSPKRKRESEALANGFAALADRVIKTTGKAVALICMEQLDEAIANRVLHRMARPESARIFSAQRYDASQMTTLLRGLDLLVTSRFHAAVLSLKAGVPQVAVHHDTRLSTLYQDLGLKEQWFMDPGALGGLENTLSCPEFFAGLQKRVDVLLKNPELQRAMLYRGHKKLEGLARQNRWYLADFVSRNFNKREPRDYPAEGPVPALYSEGGAAWAA